MTTSNLSTAWTLIIYCIDVNLRSGKLFNIFLDRMTYFHFRSVDGNSGVYNIPEYGSLVFAGIQGFVSVLQTIRLNNDMGHQLFNNLRAGNWAMDYTLFRIERQLQVNESEKQKWTGLYNWLKNYFEAVSTLMLPLHIVNVFFCRLKSSLVT